MEFSFGKALAICAMAAGILCFTNPISNFFFDYLANPDDLERTVAKSWDKILKTAESERNKFRSIAIGTNGDIDVIVKGTDLLRKLGVDEKSEATIKPMDRETINNFANLQEVFTYFFSKGAGGERFMNNRELYSKAVATSKAMPRAELYVGGNAALMAQTLSQVAPWNIRILYGGRVGPELKPMLDKKILIPEFAKSKDDEFHIIMEFAKGEKWAGNVCPIASRFIFSHDITNGQMLALEGFINGLDQFRPDLIVLTGLHMLESQREDFWKRRLAEVAVALSSVSDKIPIHLELASMANGVFVKMLSERIFPMVHSIGLNEQELWLVCQSSNGPHCKRNGENVELTGPPAPGVSNDIVHWMLEEFSNRKYPKSRLGRVHFHTLTYHTVASLSSSKWLHGDSSVAAGTRIASTQSCGDDTVHPEKVELRLNKVIKLTAGGLPEKVTHPEDTRFQHSKPVLHWETNKIKFYLSPVLVCKAPVKTVGLGDAISSSGLLYAGYNRES